MGSFRAAAERAYRRLLGVYPEEFRADYGDEMSLLFADRSRDERLLPLVLEVLADTLKTAPKEHIAMWSRDLRDAVRTMRHSPGFTIIAAGSLAIGIGANAAIFSLADALVLRPLPIERPSEVVSVRGRDEGSALGPDFSNVSYLDYVDFRDRSRSFRGLVACDLTTAAMARDAATVPQLTFAMLVSGNFFDVLGVTPALGRAFRPEEDQAPGRNPVAVLGHGTWQSLFGADPDVLGRTVRLNGVDLTVIGVAPSRFTGISLEVRPAVFVPLAMAPAIQGPDGTSLLTKRDERGLSVKGRLADGVTVREAEAELLTLARDLEREHPETNREKGVTVRTEVQARIESSTDDAALIAMLMALVALVLLIACANVASLLVSRSAARSRQIGIRLALGASRARLVRQLLTESLLLALLGGMLGLGLAYAGVAFFRLIPVSTDLPVVIDVRLDTRIVLFSLAAAVSSVLAFGLAPALRAARSDLVSSLKAGESGVASRGGTRGQQVLVVAQIALSLVLLAASASIMRSFQRTLSAEPGFRTDGLLLASYDPTVLRYPLERTRAFYRQLIAEAARLPGVRAASLTRAIALSNQQHVIDFVPEGTELRDGRQTLTALGNVVGPRYFEVAGIPLVSGRAFAETDDQDAPRVAIVNEEMASRYWPGQDPLGKRLRLEGTDGPEAEVVGVARTHKYTWIGEPTSPFVYLPYAQTDLQRMTLMLLADGDPAALVAPLRAVAASVAAEVPMHNVRTMRDLFLSRGVGIPRTLVQTVAAMGLLGLALALVGLYGLMTYTVGRRTREIGIRMAIGAGRGTVLRMILRQGLGLALIGIGVGLAVSLGVARALALVITGVELADPIAVVFVPMALVAVTAVATIAPARRAARIDPLRALRQD